MTTCCFSRERCGPIAKTLVPASGYKVPEATLIEPWNQWICLHVFTQTTYSTILLSEDGTHESVLEAFIQQDPHVEHTFPLVSIRDCDQACTTMLSTHLTSRRVDTSLIPMIIEDIHKFCRDISLEDLEARDYQMYNMGVFIPYYCEDVVCEACAANDALRESMDIRMVPASMSWVEKLLKKVEVKDKDDIIAVDDQEKAKRLYVNQGDNCSICLEEFCTKQCVLGMPCSHAFHEKCITDWLEQSHFCPLCRFPMPTDDDDDDEEEEING